MNVFNEFHTLFGSYNSYIKTLDMNYSMLSTKKLQELTTLVMKYQRVKTDKFTLKEIYENLEIPNILTTDVTSWIVQGSLRHKDKYRHMAINEGRYYDHVIDPTNPSVFDIINKFKSLK
jgi:hypothetical protein